MPVQAMQIFIQDDRAYQQWITHHRRAFVIDGRRRSGWREMLLHRSSCPQVHSVGSLRVHWTTAGQFKACAPSWKELQTWATEETGAGAHFCDRCQPLAANHATSAEPLTQLAADVLDYVLEAASIHLEHDYPPYQLRVADIAVCFATSPAALSDALIQLSREGCLDIVGTRTQDNRPRAHQPVYPTPTALRTLPAYREMTPNDLQAELSKLQFAF